LQLKDSQKGEKKGNHMGLLKSQSLSTIQDIAYRDPIISTQFIDKNEIFLLQHTYFQL
jgi:hypothetical protein